MTARDPGELDARILIFAPLGRDGPLIEAVLRESGFSCFACAESSSATARSRRSTASR